jgi:hypothetical protein
MIIFYLNDFDALYFQPNILAIIILRERVLKERIGLFPLDNGALDYFWSLIVLSRFLLL